MTKYGSNEQERAIIRQIDYLRKKQMSYQAISETLNCQMIPTKIGRKWVPALVRNIYRGETHRGLKHE
jgi:hypothetical protein